MKILLTNDDAWDAEGLAVLRQAVKELELGEIWTVAPLHPMSGISHRITFEQPLTLQQTDEFSYSLDGTPADCVRVACSQLKQEFDWVLSGINNGANLGTDIYLSGTVAAAREAAFHGIRSIALSQHRCRFNADFDWTASLWMARYALKRLLMDEYQDSADWENVSAINVNFPDQYHRRDATDNSVTCQELAPADKARFIESLSIVVCPADKQPLPSDFRIDDQGRLIYCGKYYLRARTPGCDIEACFGGAITISRLMF